MFTANPAAPAATLLALRERETYCDVEVAYLHADGDVHIDTLVDLEDGYLVLADDEGRRIDVLPDEVETIEATCIDCGGDYDAPGNPDDCAHAFDGGHVLETCGGCGETASSTTDPAAHRRCNLIP